MIEAPRRAALIWNPTAGGGGLRRVRAVSRFCELLAQSGVHATPWATDGPGAAQTLAARAVREGFGEIIVAGGDGTFNEALQGLEGKPLARFGFWPQGTANVLAREIGLPRKLENIVAVLARGKTRKVYLGCATPEATQQPRYFFLMAGIGLDASVVQSVNPTLKKKFGKGAFWLAGLAHLAYWTPRPFTVAIAGQSHTATFAALGRASRYGSDLAITPRARMDAAEFEICLISARKPLRYLALLRHAMRSGVPLDVPDVKFFSATAARAEGTTMDVQVDGEYLGQLPMNFTIAPQPMEIIVP